MPNKNKYNFEGNIDHFGKFYSYTVSQELDFLDSFQTKNIHKNNECWIAEIKLASQYETTFFITLFFENQPIVLSSVQLLKITSNAVRKKMESNITSVISKLFFSINSTQLLILGNVFRTESPTYVYEKQQISSELSFDFILEIAKQLTAKVNPTLLILKEIENQEDALLSIKKNEFTSSFPDPTTELKIDPFWKSLDDYAHAITRKYATRFHKISSQRENFEVKELSYAEILKSSNHIHALYKSTLNDQEIVICEVKQNYWAALKQIHNDNFKLYGFYIKNRLVAFYSTFEDEENLELYYVGFEEEANLKHQLYFNILFFGLETAIKQNKSKLKLGRTAWDAKFSLGAIAKENQFHIKAICLKGRMVDAILACSEFIQTPTSSNRNPFRKQNTVVEI